MKTGQTIGFDADDTLWENEVFFHKAQIKFKKLHPHIKDPDEEIFQIEKKNVKLYGYGIKGFTLSLIEASAKYSSNQTNIENITEILNIGKEMLTHQLELLPGVEETLKYLSDQFKLIMITKGDLFDQQRKIQESGLSKYFSSIEIVSEKDEKAYADILTKHGILPKNFIMVGNSLRSDILPVTKIGGTGIFIPHQYTWIHEKVDETQSANNYIKLKSILDLKLWLRKNIKTFYQPNRKIY